MMIGSTVLDDVIAHGSVKISGGMETADSTYPMADNTYADSIYQGVKVLEYNFDLVSVDEEKMAVAISAINAGKGSEFWPDSTKFFYVSSAYAQETNTEGDIHYGSARIVATKPYYYDYYQYALDTTTYGATLDAINNGNFPASPTYISVVGSYPHCIDPYLCVLDWDTSVLAQWGMISELKDGEELKLYPDQELMITTYTMHTSTAIWAREIVNPGGGATSYGTYIYMEPNQWYAYTFTCESGINFSEPISVTFTADVALAGGKLLYQKQPNGPWLTAGNIIHGTQTIKVNVTGSTSATIIFQANAGGYMSIVDGGTVTCKRKVPKKLIPKLDCSLPRYLQILTLSGTPASTFIGFRARRFF